MQHSRSPGRWLGPLALLAALVAVFVIFNATTSDEEPTPTAQQTSTGAKKNDGDTKKSTTGAEETSDSDEATTTTPKSGRKTYKVRPGDTLAGIAESTGVSIEEIQELNPDVDSNSLSIGQELRLAR